MARPRNPLTPATPDILRDIGEASFGERWYSALASSLSRYHPDQSDMHAALVRNWALGKRSIPEWVSRALVLAAISENKKLEIFQNEITERRERLDQAIGLLIDRGSSTISTTPDEIKDFDITVNEWISRSR